MGVVDFAAYVDAAIEAGSLVEGNVVKIMSDAGTEVGEAVFKVIEGGNGVASDVGVGVQSGASGAIATGLSYLFLDVGVVGAAVAPALGVLAGVGLYNIKPEIWNKIADDLTEAAETVGGKVITYWDGANLYLSKKTIEIIKNALLKAGIFNVGKCEVDDTSVLHYPDAYTQPIELTDTIFYLNQSGNISHSTYGGEDVYIIVTQLSTEPGRSFPIIISKYANKKYYDWTPGHEPMERNVGNVLHFTKNGNSYYGSAWSSSTDMSGVQVNKINTDGSLYLDQITADIAEIVLYGNMNTDSDLEEGATYPDAEEFPLTYPTWLPYEYPLVLPQPEVLPDVFPIKFPETEPDPYPEQQPAQNPLPEPVPNIYPEILPSFPQPEPGVNPEPSPEVDPDPGASEDPIPEDPDPVNPKDPVDPNPGPGQSPIIPIPPLPSTVNSNKLFTVYNPTASQLDALGGYLWDSSIIAALRDIWQEPMDGLISLQQIFVTPNTGGSHNIILGFLDTGVSSAVVSDQFITVDCGLVSVPEDKGNATDYAPYTSLHLFLPFIGFVELDTAECMNANIDVTYKIDVYTGTCLAQVGIVRSADMPNKPIIYSFSGNCSQQLPLTSGNATGLFSALVGAGVVGLSVASGGALSPIAGASMIGNTLTHEMAHVSHSGNLTANAGILGQKKPYLIISRRHGYDANNYNSFYGYPANKTVNIGNHQGFLRVKVCWLKTSALQEEYEEIMRLLEEGVFV